MKNITIITGPARSGKTRMAEKIAEKFNKDEVCFIQIKRRDFRADPFLFHCCNENTKLIIVDDVYSLQDLKDLVYDIFGSDFIRINKQGKWPFYIKVPQVIITCDELITDNIVSCALTNRVMNKIELIQPKHTHSITQ